MYSGLFRLLFNPKYFYSLFIIGYPFFNQADIPFVITYTCSNPMFFARLAA